MYATRSVSPFDPNEELYRRFNSDCYTFGQVAPQAFRFPDCSVNRQTLSRPEDVINGCDPPKPDWGIAVLYVSDTLHALSCNKGVVYEFEPIHVPRPELGNESHSEIQAFTGAHTQRVKAEPPPPREVRKQIRTILASKCRVLKPPKLVRI